VDAWALAAIGWKYYLVYCVWLGFELVFVIVYIVETRGRTLEETAALFDGEEKLDILSQSNRGAAVLSTRRPSALGDKHHDEDSTFSFLRKADSVECYELRPPQLVLGRDRIGHTKGRNTLGGRG